MRTNKYLVSSPVHLSAFFVRPGSRWGAKEAGAGEGGVGAGHDGDPGAAGGGGGDRGGADQQDGGRRGLAYRAHHPDVVAKWTGETGRGGRGWQDSHLKMSLFQIL